MSRVASSGIGVRAVREFGEALRSWPFRVALILSLLAHLALLALIGRGGPAPGAAERRVPLMRVRLLSPVAAPGAVPAAPAPRQRRPERPGEPAAQTVKPG